MPRTPHSNSTAAPELPRFAPPRTLLGLALTVVVTVVWLSSADRLQALLQGRTQTSPLALEYYRLLNQRHPDNLDYRLAWAHGLLQTGRPREAMEVLAPFLAHPPALSLYLEALRTRFFATRDATERRRILIRLARLSDRLDTPARIEPAAATAVAIGTHELALRLYRRLLIRANTPEQKREAFLALLRTALAMGRPRRALALAIRHLPLIPADHHVYRLLTRLSLSATAYDCAIHFARRLVELPDSGTCTVD